MSDSDPPSAAARTAAYGLLWMVLLGVIAARRPAPVEWEDLPDAPAAAEFRVDLNRDPWTRIILIEGIGEKRAKQIVAAREERGGFASLEEVMQLPGIPDAPLWRARAWLDPPAGGGAAADPETVR